MVATRASPSANGRISLAPSEQLTPTISGRACSTDVQNASTVWPERLRPLLSIAVKEIQSGRSGATSAAAAIAAFGVQRVEDRLDQEQVHPALVERRDLLGVRLLDLVERVRAVGRILDARREGERDVQRPDRARDEAAELVRDLAREPRARDAHLVGVVLERVVGLADRRGGERVRGGDVRAGLEVRAVDRGHDLGPRDVEEIRVAGDVARMVAEALAAVGLLPRTSRWISTPHEPSRTTMRRSRASVSAIRALTASSSPDSPCPKRSGAGAPRAL